MNYFNEFKEYRDVNYVKIKLMCLVMCVIIRIIAAIIILGKKPSRGGNWGMVPRRRWKNMCWRKKKPRKREPV